MSAVETDKGVIKTDYVVVGAGPWVKSIWEMLDLPKTVTIKGRDGTLHPDIPMWTFWCLQEGTLGVDPDLGKLDNGEMPPVIHVDTDAPLYSDIDGSLITDKIWGLYYKPDFCYGGVQGGAMPYKVPEGSGHGAGRSVRPRVAGVRGRRRLRAHVVLGAGVLPEALRGQVPLYKKEPTGGIGAFSPDSFPVFDVYKQNCYVIADSNHGYKMLGVGKLVAEEIMGRRSAILEPFRFARYAEGKLHPVSRSPFPWS